MEGSPQGLQARKAALADAVLGSGAEAGTTARFDLVELQALLAPLDQTGTTDAVAGPLNRPDWPV